MSQKKREVLNIFKPQNAVTGGQVAIAIDDNNIAEKGQLPAVSNYFFGCKGTSSFLIGKY